MTTDIPDGIIATIRKRAWRGYCDGTDSCRTRAYIDDCSHFHAASGTLILFTRDQYHHTSGWMKNPDYERCWHLSLSFRAPLINWSADRLANPSKLAMLGAVIPLAPFDWPLARRWVDLILRDDAIFAWTETAKSPQGKELDVVHWRVFCDANWQAIQPRGEVYSNELTEAGWRSWSEIGADRPSHIDAD